MPRSRMGHFFILLGAFIVVAIAVRAVQSATATPAVTVFAAEDDVRLQQLIISGRVFTTKSGAGVLVLDHDGILEVVYPQAGQAGQAGWVPLEWVGP